MSIMEISLPTGYEAVNTNEVSQQVPNVIKLVENNVDDGVVVVYLDGVRHL